MIRTMIESTHHEGSMYMYMYIYIYISYFLFLEIWEGIQLAREITEEFYMWVLMIRYFYVIRFDAVDTNIFRATTPFNLYCTIVVDFSSEKWSFSKVI